MGKKIYSKNSTGLLEYPEFQVIEQLKKVNRVIQDENQILQFFCEMDETTHKDSPEVKASIGEENKTEALSEVSVIHSNLCVEGDRIAKIACLGPTRMDYPDIFLKIDTVVGGLKNKINALFM